jgi:NADH dehydrogenase FAD-containing subunit
MGTQNAPKHIVVVGGFAEIGCARGLAGQRGVRVTLIDTNNYHQFQPGLSRTATHPALPPRPRKAHGGPRSLDPRRARL